MRRVLEIVGYIGITATILIGVVNPLMAPVYTYVRKEVANNWSALQTFTAGYDRPTVKTVEICQSGCKYTTLNAACVANTSTAATPIQYYVHAGTYAAANTMCNGEDHASFVGDGIGVTILQGFASTFGSNNTSSDCSANPQACKGALNLFDSTNYSIRNMSLKGTRGLFASTPSGVGGGDVWIDNVEFVTTAPATQADGTPDGTFHGDEDCFLLRDVQDSTVIRVTNSRCSTNSDGFTYGQHGSTNVGTMVLAANNTFDSPSGNTVTICGWNLSSIPGLFSASGEKMVLSGSRTGGGGVIGYRFVGSGTGGGVAIINGASISVTNTAGLGAGGAAYGIAVESGATELTALDVNGSYITSAVPTDTTAGASVALSNQEAASWTATTVTGGSLIATGGLTASRSAWSVTGGTHRIAASTYITPTPLDTEVTLVPVNALLPVAGLTSTATTGYTATITYNATDANVGMALENTDGSNNESSPYLKFSSSDQSEENRYINVDNGGVLQFLDGSFGLMASMSTSTVQAYHGSLKISGAGDDNNLFFDGNTNDGFIKYHETGAGTFDAKALELNNMVTIRLTATGTKPAKCAVGDWYIDNTGTVGFCVCTVAGTPGTWFDVIAAASPGNCT